MSSSAVSQDTPEPATRSTRSLDGTKIAFDLFHRPSRSVVVVVPGFWRTRRHPAMQRFASFVNAAGYAAAVCDLRGHGDSEGMFGFNLSEHQDTAAVCEELLRSRSYESITLVGLSYGGAIAISTAARHKLPLASLLLISPVADFSTISPRINLFTLHRHIALGQALQRPRFEWRGVRSSPKLRAIDDVADVHVPICLVHVKNDWLIDHSHSLALYERANEPKELHVIDIPGNYHADRMFNVAADRVDPIISAFLECYSPK
jgi:alpha-beta hydrolase superfamily lysophospholipase